MVIMKTACQRAAEIPGKAQAKLTFCLRLGLRRKAVVPLSPFERLLLHENTRREFALAFQRKDMPQEISVGYYAIWPKFDVFTVHALNPDEWEVIPKGEPGAGGFGVKIEAGYPIITGRKA